MVAATSPGTARPAGFDRLLAPDSVAVVGSLSAPHKPGARTVDHLRRAGYPGRVQAVGSVSELDGDVDVAVVAVPAAAVTGVLEQLDGRAQHAVVYSSGFAETGGEALDRFHRGGLSILGPNTVGLYVAASSTALAFAQALGPVIDRSGRDAATAPAMVTQSGAFGARLTSAALRRGVPLGTFLATGNEDGYTLADVLEGLAASTVVSPGVVLVYVEAVAGAARLQGAVRSLVDDGVEVLVLAGGRSATGARAATSHTAALGGDTEVLGEALQAAGAVVVRGDRELLDALVVLSLHGRAGGRRVGVLTGSGGAGVVAADLLAGQGLQVPPLSDRTRARLDGLLPAFASTTNPVDVTASAIGDPGTLTACAEVVAGSGEVDMLITVGRAEQAGAVQAAAAPLPALATVLDAGTDDLGRLATEGVAATGDLSTASHMAAVLAARAALPEAPLVTGDEVADPAGTGRSTPRASSPATPPTAAESLGLVERYGIVTAPWQRAGSVAEAAAAAERLGHPVALKADLAADVHKAGAGAVRLDVTADTLPGAAEELLTVAPSLVVARQLRGGIELLAGARRDEHFGVVLVAGLGGGHVELLGRTVSVPARAGAGWLAHRARQVAFGGHGPPGVTERLAEVAHRLGQLVQETGCAAAECNPLIETDQGVTALDARVVLT